MVYGNDSTCFVETFIKEHLGNMRVAYANDGLKDVIRQVNAYYPFGMNIRGLSSNKRSIVVQRNEYQYNGKMYQDEMGLNWYDYGARFYDAGVGRWWSVDPSADEEGQEVASPYCYVENNPISRYDPDGKIWGNIIGAVVGGGVEIAGQAIAQVASGKNLSDVITGGKSMTQAGKEFAGNMATAGVGARTQKVVNASTKQAVSSANKQVVRANNAVATAENRLANHPNSPKAQTNVNNAKFNAQTSRNSQVKTQMTHNTVGCWGFYDRTIKKI